MHRNEKRFLKGVDFRSKFRICSYSNFNVSFKKYPYPISARNSWSLFFPFIVQTRNLQAVVGVCNILSNRDQCLYSISCNSLSKCIRKQLMETGASSLSGLQKDERPIGQHLQNAFVPQKIRMAYIFFCFSELKKNSGAH